MWRGGASKAVVGGILLFSAFLGSAWPSSSSDVIDLSQPAQTTGLSPALRGPATPVHPQSGPPCTPGELLTGVDVGQRKLVAFTFDDGPWPSLTRSAMNTFEAHGVRATFFLIGMQIRLYPTIAKEIVERGHTVGSHTMSHSYSPSRIASEIVTTNDLIEETTGVRPYLFRSPGLTQGDVIQRTLAEQGMCNIFTTADLHDTAMPRRSSATLCSSFAANLHPGFIALLHDGGGSHESTVGAIDCMLDVAEARGYSIIGLGELLGEGRHYFGGRQVGQAAGDRSDEIIGE